MISATILTKFMAAMAFLWLLSLLSCESDLGDAAPAQGIDDAQGAYSGYLKIGNDSFPDIEVVLNLHSATEMKISSSSDLIPPFSFNLEEDFGIVQQTNDGAPWFVSINFNESPAKISIVYTDSDKYFFGRKLY
jgi:hypothetical protein